MLVYTTNINNIVIIILLDYKLYIMYMYIDAHSFKKNHIRSIRIVCLEEAAFRKPFLG